MKRTMSMFAAVAALAVGFLFAAPAANAQVPHCTDYRVINPAASQVYPNDGHFFTCFNGVSLQRANNVLGVPQGFPKQGQGGRQFLGAWDILKAQGVKFFYFANRTDANNYFNNTAPYAGQGDGVFSSSTARCGQTGYIQSSGVIASAIYDTCTYSHTQPPQNPSNPDLNHVTAHESGHAFDYSLAAQRSNQQTVPRSRLSGYRTLLLDMAKGDFTQMANMATCSVFDSISLPVTKLEFDLGYPTAVSSSVCTGTTVNPPFQGLNNPQISTQQMPYFFNPPQSPVDTRYSELFAQEFSFLAAGQSGSTFLRLTDMTIKQGAQCSLFDVRSYWDTGYPPGPSNPYQAAYGKFPANCPQPAENQL